MRMITDTANFDAAKVTFGEPKVMENIPGVGKCMFIHIKYDGGRLVVKTAKCFCWGIQKNNFKGAQKEGYSLPLVMNRADRSVEPGHDNFVRVFNEVVEECKKHCIASKVKKNSSYEDMGSCMYQKEGKDQPTLYTKVRFGGGKFITGFQKSKIKKGEDKTIKPEDVLDQRCEAVALVCFESIFVSSKCCTMQVKVNEALLNFEAITPKLELEPEVEEGMEDEW